MNTDYKKKLIEEIEKSGFPLELDVFERLRKMEYTVQPNISYIDRNDNIREIDDIIILAGEPDKEWPYGCIHLDVLLECKSSKKYPWIFFEDPDPYPASLVMGLSSNLKYYTDIDEGLGLLAGHMNTELRMHHYNSNIPTARTYCEAFGKDSGGNIYKAIHSIWSAIAFNVDAIKNAINEQNRKRSIFMQGVIVFKGDLLLARKIDDAFDIQPSQHIILRTTDCLNDRRSPLAPNRETIIDVIKEDYLEEYIHLCENDLTHIISHLNLWKNSLTN